MMPRLRHHFSLCTDLPQPDGRLDAAERERLTGPDKTSPSVAGQARKQATDQACWLVEQMVPRPATVAMAGGCQI
jgi:hypothetical protein